MREDLRIATMARQDEVAIEPTGAASFRVMRRLGALREGGGPPRCGGAHQSGAMLAPPGLRARKNQQPVTSFPVADRVVADVPGPDPGEVPEREEHPDDWSDGDSGSDPGDEQSDRDDEDGSDLPGRDGHDGADGHHQNRST